MFKVKDLRTNKVRALKKIKKSIVQKQAGGLDNGEEVGKRGSCVQVQRPRCRGA